MELTHIIDDLEDVPEFLLDDSIFDSFLRWTRDQGIELYPAQEESVLAALSGDNVIVSTPTGSGKSMIALGAHFIALAKGQRTFYTAPIKALVSEKFFSLCTTFGPENVGMMTGDATVNGSAPIICATAEIVANIALREGHRASIDQVVMDEFHYYSDPQRGWAWQVPLLELPQAQFILMSATLGDTTAIEKDLTERTERKTTRVSGTTRPVPLEFSYVYTPVHETVQELVGSNLAPIYVVHFSQREAAERAQALTSMKLISKEDKQVILDEIGSFRFTTAFGRELRKLLVRGIGVHHAGMLPKYRRLVEKISQTGALKVICGTDTLGVGINVPIRTVLLTGLAKYDGIRSRILSSREFHQIAGRAGRAGYDTQGTVIIQAPEHEIENFRLRERAGTDPKKLKKLRLKSAREGEVSWTKKTFERLTQAEPEQLTSQFQVSNSLVINILSRPGDVYEHFKNLLRGNHDPRAKQNKDVLVTIDLVRGLIRGGVAERLDELDEADRRYTLTTEIQRDFALNQPLSPFALAALDLLDPESPAFTLDVISTFESILDDPGPILRAQQKAARDEAIAQMKADGVDYADRMNAIEDITWPKPLEEELEQAYEIFCETAPWAKEHTLSPKSILRDMIEKAMTFSDMVATYGLARAEGVVLRYLSDCWNTLSHSLPENYHTDGLDEILTWLGEMIRQVDSSLVDEWARLADPDAPVSEELLKQELAFGVTDPDALTANRRAFTVMVRNTMFRIVSLFAKEEEDRLAELVSYLDNAPDFSAAMDDYFDEYEDIDDGPEARGAAYFRIENQDGEHSRSWKVRQILKDPEGNNSHWFNATVDLDASDEAGEVRLSSLEFISS